MASAKITVEGFVALTPETRTVTGHTITTVKVVVTPQKKNSSGAWEDTGDGVWYAAEFWDEHGDAIATQVAKGALVTISGNLEIRIREKDGRTFVDSTIGFATLGVIVRKPSRGYAERDQWHTPTPTIAPTPQTDTIPDELPW